jgi:hypothetical protein
MVKVWIVVFFCLIARSLQAQPVNIRVSGDDELDAEEVSIAVSQSDPDHIAIGANLNYLFSSNDRGKSWMHSRMTSQYGVWGDPALTFEGDRLYYAHLAGSIFGDSATWLRSMIVQQSLNLGLSWTSDDSIADNFPKQQDKPTIAEAGYTLTGVSHSRMLMAWTQFDHYASTYPTDSSHILLSQAINGQWQHAIRVDDTAGTCLDDDQTAEGAVVASGRKGEVFVVWARDGKIYFDRSLTPDLQFGNDMIIAIQHNGWDIQIPGLYRANAFPTIACDTTIHRIYVVWSEQRNNETDIYMRYSDDAGDNWSSIGEVNLSEGQMHHFYPSLALDRTTGHLAVEYYAFDSEMPGEVSVYLARSHDHGETWSNERISARAFQPNDRVFFGDYIQVAADHGYIYPAWMRVDSTALSVWTAVIADTPVAGVSSAPVQSDGLSVETTLSGHVALSFSLQADAIIRITTIDALGRKLRTELHGAYGAGSYRIGVSADGSSGVRCVRMSVERNGAETSYFTKYVQ